MSIYTDFVKAGCEIDHHESDLYVKDSAVARDVIVAAQKECELVPFEVFTGTDGRQWLDLPFAYDPFWAPGSLVEEK